MLKSDCTKVSRHNGRTEVLVSILRSDIGSGLTAAIRIRNIDRHSEFDQFIEEGA